MHQSPIVRRSWHILDRVTLGIDPHLQRVVLKFTLARLIAHTALKGVVDIVDLHDRPSLFGDVLGQRGHLHAILGLGVTGIDLLPVGLHQTDTAGQCGTAARQVADGGDENTVGARDVEDIFTLFRSALFSVYLDRDFTHWLAPKLLFCYDCNDTSKITNLLLSPSQRSD